MRWMNQHPAIDLNCDLGEVDGADGLDLDAALIPLISSANVACGGHAGDQERMRQVARLCRQHGVAFGAHPGYADPVGFGRRVISMSTGELFDLISWQLKEAGAAAASEGIRVIHVKPHGALYNLSARNPEMAEIIVDAIRSYDRSLVVFGLSRSRLIDAGRKAGLATVSEAFADRACDGSGALIDRSIPGAVIAEPAVVAQRALRMIQSQSLKAIDGVEIPCLIETLCLHGDTPNAVQSATAIRRTLEQSGIAIRFPSAKNGAAETSASS